MNAAVAQSVERRIGSAEVTGPIPVSSFIFLSKNQKNVWSITSFHLYRFSIYSGIAQEKVISI